MRMETCRVCRSRLLHGFLDLGPTALANSFVRDGQDPDAEPMYPLRLVVCEDCGLVQIDEEVPPEALFRDYIYITGTSDLVFRHARWLAETFVGRYGLGRDSLAVEAASNDGTILQALRAAGLRTLGVEPARNIAERANAAGIDTVCDFFNATSARAVRSRYGPAKLFLGRHVLAHVADLHGFVEGIATLLDDDGVGVVEVPYLLPFFENLEFDTVYHEHLCYFSVRVLRHLFAGHGLTLIDVTEVPIHGGSILAAFQRAGGGRPTQPVVEAMLRREEECGLHRAVTWAAFAERVEASRRSLLAELDGLKEAGLRVAGYGAPAKGNTLMSYCGIGPDRIAYLVDKSPYKQGFRTPGHHIPIYSPEKLLEDQPDVVLILAWNFAEEIVAQQEEYRRRGGRFLIPIPRARYVA